VLENAELIKLYLPMLRADFTLVETYIYKAEEPLACPITALGGLQDTSVSRADLASWATYTQSSFALHMFPGDHFFVRGAQSPVVQAVVQDLAGNSLFHP
jgi:medium-chain acyl-[acyl-carrier-protein] hydrolase